MPVPDLSPHALASLVAIAEYGSVSAAARARRLTQPSISRQIQELERQLSVQLVERTPSGTRLTPAGEALVEGARDALAALSALPDRVRQREGEIAGRVRLGTVDSIGIYQLPPILAAFVQRHPRVDVQVVCQPSPVLMTKLLGDDLDVAVGTTDHKDLVCERLYQNPLVLAHPHGVPERSLPATLADLARHRIVTFHQGLTVRTLIDQAFAKAGLTFRPVMELANVEVIKAMVRAGLGLGIIPDGSVHGFELATRPIRGLDLARTVRLMHRRQVPGLAVQALITALRAELAKP
jgi:DNA-binding transcriptional LysR family regulator